MPCRDPNFGPSCHSCPRFPVWEMGASPLLREQARLGRGVAGGSTCPLSAWGPFTHTLFHKARLRGRSDYSHPTDVETEAESSAICLHEVGSDSKTPLSPQPRSLSAWKTAQKERRMAFHVPLRTPRGRGQRAEGKGQRAEGTGRLHSQRRRTVKSWRPLLSQEVPPEQRSLCPVSR